MQTSDDTEAPKSVDIDRNGPFSTRVTSLDDDDDSFPNSLNADELPQTREKLMEENATPYQTEKLSEKCFTPNSTGNTAEFFESGSALPHNSLNQVELRVVSDSNLIDSSTQPVSCLSNGGEAQEGLNYATKAYSSCRSENPDKQKSLILEAIRASKRSLPSEYARSDELYNKHASLVQKPAQHICTDGLTKEIIISAIVASKQNYQRGETCLAQFSTITELDLSHTNCCIGMPAESPLKGPTHEVDHSPPEVEISFAHSDDLQKKLMLEGISASKKALIGVNLGEEESFKLTQISPALLQKNDIPTATQLPKFDSPNNDKLDIVDDEQTLDSDETFTQTSLESQLIREAIALSGQQLQVTHPPNTSTKDASIGSIKASNSDILSSENVISKETITRAIAESKDSLPFSDYNVSVTRENHAELDRHQLERSTDEAVYADSVKRDSVMEAIMTSKESLLASSNRAKFASNTVGVDYSQGELESSVMHSNKSPKSLMIEALAASKQSLCAKSSDLISHDQCYSVERKVYTEEASRDNSSVEPNAKNDPDLLHSNTMDDPKHLMLQAIKTSYSFYSNEPGFSDASLNQNPSAEYSLVDQRNLIIEAIEASKSVKNRSSPTSSIRSNSSERNISRELIFEAVASAKSNQPQNIDSIPAELPVSEPFDAFDRGTVLPTPSESLPESDLKSLIMQGLYEASISMEGYKKKSAMDGAELSILDAGCDRDVQNYDTKRHIFDAIKASKNALANAPTWSSDEGYKSKSRDDAPTIPILDDVATSECDIKKLMLLAIAAAKHSVSGADDNSEIIVDRKATFSNEIAYNRDHDGSSTNNHVLYNRVQITPNISPISHSDFKGIMKFSSKSSDKDYTTCINADESSQYDDVYELDASESSMNYRRQKHNVSPSDFVEHVLTDRVAFSNNKLNGTESPGETLSGNVDTEAVDPNDTTVTTEAQENPLFPKGATLGSRDSAFQKWPGAAEAQSESVKIAVDFIPIEPTSAAEQEIRLLQENDVSDPPTSSPRSSVDLSRYSPAHVVAVTGGAPTDMLRHFNSGDQISLLHDEHPPCGDLLTKPEDPSGHLIAISLVPTAELNPASPDDVEASSDIILGSFIVETYQRESNTVSQPRGSNMENPFGPEFENIPRAAPDSLEAAVAQRLAQWGDEINVAYGAQLDRMINFLPSDKCPLQSFSDVARVLFSWGPTNWGQVVALFCFGYRLVVRRLRLSVVDAFRQVYNCLLSFCRQVNLFVWIAAQGGWQIVQYLRLSNRSVVVPTPSTSSAVVPQWMPPVLVGLAAVCAAVLMYRVIKR